MEDGLKNMCEVRFLQADYVYFSLDFFYAHGIIMPASGCGEAWYRAWFGSMRPRVRIPALRPQRKPAVLTAAGYFFTCSLVVFPSVFPYQLEIGVINASILAALSCLVMSTGSTGDLPVVLC